MSKSKPPAFQFYPGDWLSSPRVMLMTPEQEGAYVRLLCYDWSSDGIPDDDATLSVLSRLGEGWFKGGSTVVKGCFIPHPEKPGFLTNNRLKEERKKQKEWAKKSSDGGIKSAQSRRNKKLKGGSICLEPNLNRPVEPNANSSSSSSSSKFSRPSVGEVDSYGRTLKPPFTRAAAFVHFYDSNGWKVGKNSMKSWQAAVRTWHSKDNQSSQPTLDESARNRSRQ